MADMEKLEQRISELERRIQIQEDIRAIERLQANYWDCLDKKDWDRLRACFTDDFVFINNTTGGRYVGGDGMLATMKCKFTDNVTSSHHGHHHWVEITGEDTAHRPLGARRRSVRRRKRRRVRRPSPLRQQVYQGRWALVCHRNGSHLSSR